MDDLFSTSGQKRGKWPSEQLAEYLGGEVAERFVEPAIVSWGAFYIHDAAKQLLAIDGKENRRAALGKIPAVLRHKVEDEVRRLWALRKPRT